MNASDPEPETDPQPDAAPESGRPDGDTAEAGRSTAGPDGAAGGDRVEMADARSDAAPRPPHPSDIVFDENRVDTYELTLAPADLQKLNADPTAEQYVPAMLKVGAEDVGRVGVRYKGFATTLRACVSTGQITCKKLSYKIKVDAYEPEKRFHALKHIVLNSLIRDDTLLHERLAYRLFRDAGIMAPRAGHAWVSVNGQAKGLFGLAEQIDGRFTDYRFPKGQGDGNLYKQVWPRSLDPMYYSKGQRTNEGIVPPT